jgi:hypothetical protein
LLANAIGQLRGRWLKKRVRQQAGSYKLGWNANASATIVPKRYVGVHTVTLCVILK